jgi:hypothetical protein
MKNRRLTAVIQRLRRQLEAENPTGRTDNNILKERLAEEMRADSTLVVGITQQASDGVDADDRRQLQGGVGTQLEMFEEDRLHVVGRNIRIREGRMTPRDHEMAVRLRAGEWKMERDRHARQIKHDRQITAEFKANPDCPTRLDLEKKLRGYQPPEADATQPHEPA